jgi:predicted nuclease of predicted toxin-antitoxin system
LKLLVDENLPPRLAHDLADLFPESTHVSLIGLGSAPDADPWEYAKTHGFAFLATGKDFADLSFARGAPPKVILLLIGHCSTAELVTVIRNNATRFSDFASDSGRSLLMLR